jgi:hypothetical protein
MNKGIVMSISKKSATVFTDDCQLVKTNVQPNMAVGKEIRMDTNTKEKKVGMQNRGFKYALLAASVVLVVVVGVLFGQGLKKNPVYAVVSVDVNPSVQFSLNQDLEVLSVKALNEEAAQILEGQNYKGLPWQEAITKWIEDLRVSNLVDIQNVLISAVMPDTAVQLQTELMAYEGADQQGALAGVNVRIIYSNDKVVSNEAEQNGLSVGRQMLLNQSQDQNQNWDKTTIADAPLGDLVQKLLRDGDYDQTWITDDEESDIAESGATVDEDTTETSQQMSGATNQSDPSGESGASETNQNTSQATNQHGNDDDDDDEYEDEGPDDD